MFSTLQDDIMMIILVDGDSSCLAFVNAGTGTRPVGFIPGRLIAGKCIIANFKFSTATETSNICDKITAYWVKLYPTTTPKKKYRKKR